MKKLATWLMALAVLVSTLPLFNTNVEARVPGFDNSEVPVRINIHKYRTLETSLPDDTTDADVHLTEIDAFGNKSEQDKKVVPVEGVVYVITKTHKLLITTAAGENSSYDFVSGQEALDSPEEYILVTDKDGIADSELPTDLALLSGRYTIRELSLAEYGKGKFASYKAPKGIVPNEKTYTFDLPYVTKNDQPDTNEYRLNYDLVISPKNLSDTAKITLKKVQISDPEKAGVEVAQSDVEFSIFSLAEDGTPTLLTKYPITGKEIGQLKTDSSGMLTVENLYPNEKYLLVEKVPAGYIADERGKVFTASKEFTYSDTEHKFVNSQITKSVSADKKTFTTTETQVSVENPYQYKIVVRMPKSDVNADGKYFPVTAYTITDTMGQLEGKSYHYFTSADAIKLHLETATGEDISSYFTVEPTMGTVNNASKVVGFTAKLKDEYLNDKYPAKLSGKAVVILADAAVDTTYFVEKKTEVLTNDVVSEVTRNQTKVPGDPNTEKETSNKPSVPVKPIAGGIKVIKHELGSESTLIANAGFTLFKLDEDKPYSRGDMVEAEKMTDSKGEASWENLASGKYILAETTAPHYMDGQTQKTYLFVDVDGQREVTVTAGETDAVVIEKVANRKPEWYLPGTGGTGTTGLIVFGLACLLLAGILIVRKRRAEQA